MRFIIGTALVALAFFSCKNKEEEKLKTPDGQEYIQHVKTGNPTPQPGDYVYFHAQIRDGEKVMRSSRSEGAEPFIQIPLQEEPGRQAPPVESVLKLMGMGDSVTLIIPLDSLQKQSMGMQSDIMYYDVVLTRIQSNEDKEKELQVVRDREEAVSKQIQETVKQYAAGQLNSQIKTTASGLKYIIHEEGTGKQAATGNLVSVNYYGVLANGTHFDDSFSRGEPISFQLGTGQVIKGWDEGLALLKEGGKATLFIPASLGYGEAGSPPVIPGNAELIFYVELDKAK